MFLGDMLTPSLRLTMEDKSSRYLQNAGDYIKMILYHNLKICLLSNTNLTFLATQSKKLTAQLNNTLTLLNTVQCSHMLKQRNLFWLKIIHTASYFVTHSCMLILFDIKHIQILVQYIYVKSDITNLLRTAWKEQELGSRQIQVAGSCKITTII